ncbi:TPM domain-containing protein [Patescibacteria group bacterium]|nr:TPM domain-containing protein [Patescibacteria group bacterium]MBU1931447.1 TPM domain-containing protein [Patescibacteria group bacterium]
MKKLLLALLIAFLLLWITPFRVQAKVWPQPQGHVNDFAQLFTPEFIQQLEVKLVDFKAQTSIEIAIATIVSLEEDTVENAAVEIFEQWGIGQKDKDNGILLLIAKEDRKIKIEVGYGLESVINDAVAGRIIRDEMASAFKQDNYEQGVLLAVEALIARLETGSGKVLDSVYQAGATWPAGFILLVCLFIYVFAFLSRSKSFYAGGVVGGFLGLAYRVMAGSSFFMIIIFILTGLFLDWLFSQNYKKLKKAGKSTSWRSSWGGFSSKHSNTSSGGFGGFSGGSSGGGGASGGW